CTLGGTTGPSRTGPQNATVGCRGDTSPAGTGTATGSDTCGSVAITFTDTVVAGCGNTRTITRHWKATDACANFTTGDQTITVGDTTRPSLTVPPNATVECTGDTSPAGTET